MGEKGQSGLYDESEVLPGEEIKYNVKKSKDSGLNAQEGNILTQSIIKLDENALPASQGSDQKED